VVDKLLAKEQQRYERKQGHMQERREKTLQLPEAKAAGETETEADKTISIEKSETDEPKGEEPEKPSEQ